MKKILVLTALLLTSNWSYAADQFTLQYQKDNRWIAQAEAAELRNLINTAKSKSVTNFKVSLAKEDRKLTIERLIVLRDILESSLKQSIIIEEQAQNSASVNTILVTLGK